MTLSLGLTKDQIAFRKNAIGGSDANKIMSGDSDKILRLWQEKRGEVEPEDLSGVLPVQMGSFTEPLNAFWFEKQTGLTVVCRGEERLSFEYPWMSATLDGMTFDGGNVLTVWEAKHVSAFAKEAEIVARYMPQLHHNMIVTGADKAVLSVFYGTLKWVAHWVDFDPIYAESLLAAEEDFWDCVKAGRQPVAGPVVAAPVAPDKMRVVDMAGKNSWASFAADWLANKAGAAKFEKSVKELKELIEPDVREASGHGIVAVRNAAGSISIKKAAA